MQFAGRVVLLLIGFSLVRPGMATELAVIVNPANPINSMSAEQAAQYFLGTSTALKPIDQLDGASIRDEFYRKVTGKEPSQVKALWSRMVFAGKGKPPKEYSSSAAVKQAIEANPLAIGYIEKSAVDGAVKVVLTTP